MQDPNPAKAVWNTTDHDYIRTHEDNEVYATDYVQLQCKVKELEQELESVKDRVLSLENIMNNDRKFQQWTNFPNYEVLLAAAEYLEARSKKKLQYWYGAWTNITRKPNQQSQVQTGKNSLAEEFFIVLVKLKTGWSVQDMASMFGVGEDYVSCLLNMGQFSGS